ncbi:hypothetical protein FRC12_010756 [Ceratobasidium sp. 428]|nr:hypothetical protein FRC12_010756 [Ceratobasidium sp. 428]
MADIVMSFGAIADVYWAYHRQVFCGSFCNAQGVLQTMGETAAALSTLAVTIYTFLAIKQNRHTYRPQLYLALVAAIWLWVLLWAVTPLAIPRGPDSDGAGNVKNFYAPTPWCNGAGLTNDIWYNVSWLNISGMQETQPIHKIFVEHFSRLWLAGIGSIVLYVPSYFSVRQQQRAIEREEVRQIPMVVQIGRFNQAEYPEVAEGPKRPVEPDARSVASSIHENSGAAKLLWYPFVYTLCVLPLSIIRWAGFVNPELLRSSRIQAPTMVFVGIFNLMGLFNVVLILLTRPAVLLMESYKNPDDHRAAIPEDNEPNAARAFSRASDGLSHREGQHERFKTDETHVNERTVVNAFGGVKTSLVRDF